MREKQAIESPGQLANRFSEELLELVDQGEISISFAERIRGDMFEDGAPGDPPKLRWTVWCAYVKECTGNQV